MYHTKFRVSPSTNSIAIHAWCTSALQCGLCITLQPLHYTTVSALYYSFCATLQLEVAHATLCPPPCSNVPQMSTVWQKSTYHKYCWGPSRSMTVFLARRARLSQHKFVRIYRVCILNKQTPFIQPLISMGLSSIHGMLTSVAQLTFKFVAHSSKVGGTA